ncbi:MAG: hypothetical protein NC299_00120 [Lachnospiraceae bacterium]|nr:hypothetical protein [Ruminococcus sp.]MCM1273751.1 hypothetical protein [Lachnospiraceae bacterium]
MIVNRTVICKADVEFSQRHSRKPRRIAFSVILVGVCGALLLILGGVMLYRAFSLGESVNAVTVAAAFVMGALFIAWSVCFNKTAVLRAMRVPSLKAPRTYEFSDKDVLCRLSLNGVDAEERYAYSIMDGFFERNNAIYIRLNVDNRQRFLVVHNDAYSDGSSAELAALLESRGVHKQSR